MLPRVTGQYLAWGMLIFMLIIFIVYFNKSFATRIKLPTEFSTHVGSNTVEIFDIAHDVQMPPVLGEECAFKIKLLNSNIIQWKVTTKSNWQGTADHQFHLVSTAEYIRSLPLIRSFHWKKVPPLRMLSLSSNYPTADASDNGLTTSNISNIKLPTHKLSFNKECFWRVSMCRNWIPDNNIPNSNYWTMGSKELQPPNLMLLFNNICLSSSDKKLLLSHFSIQHSSIGGIFSGISGEFGDVFRPVQENSLNYRNKSQDSGECGQKSSIESNRIVHRPLPKGFGFFLLGIFLVIFLGGLLLCWWLGLLSTNPWQEDKRK